MMRSVLVFLSVVLILSTTACFSSRERDLELDSGLDDTEVTVRSDGGNSIDPDTDAGMNNIPCVPNCPELDWITIPGGTFMMGSDEGTGDSYEHPQHEVNVQTFKMSKSEITVAQYRNCVEAGICSEPSAGEESNNWDNSDRENHPINAVTWFQAKEFAGWLGARLPSEAEWEYAARSGGQDIAYPWGNEEAICEYAVMGSDELGKDCENETTTQVCSKPLGDTAQGLCDMAGNVYEWVEDDWHDNYSDAPPDGYPWIDSPRGALRVLRGGSWRFKASDCRSTARLKFVPKYRPVDYIGFRLVFDR